MVITSAGAEYSFSLLSQAKQTRHETYVKCHIEVRSRNHCCCVKNNSIKYYDCVCVSVCLCILDLVIEHRKRMRCITLQSVTYYAIPHFSTVSHKRYAFRRKKCLLNTKYVFILC